jgi:Rod binding domain-containing protein
MAALSPVSHLTAPSEIAHRNRVTKAAQEFEAQLLSYLLAPLEKSFSEVPGQGSPAGSDDYAYLGIQALASALSGSGGIGIAELVSRQVMRTKVEGSASGGEERGLTKIPDGPVK